MKEDAGDDWFPLNSGQTPPEGAVKYPTTTGNLWTSSQRQSNSLHEISYRACFKAELPRFFITRYSEEGDIVYDPFMGRGTTLVEAGLNGRTPFGVDINPLSQILAAPRLDPPPISKVSDRLNRIPMERGLAADIDLSMFFHHETESELMSLRNYLLERERNGESDNVDRFIRMVATNRLTGHSPGFFSVYTLPPNQAATQESQIRINRKLKQEPAYRDIRMIILKKSSSLMRSLTPETMERLRRFSEHSMLAVCDARDTSGFIEEESVNLTVTSPPFLNVVQYKLDNWLRLWFNGIDLGNGDSEPFVTSNISEWSAFITGVFRDLNRITAPGGRVAFEVGEVKRGSVKLEDYVIRSGKEAGLDVERVFINSQSFTKTSNIWGIRNNMDGTNTNRIVLFRKPV